MTDMKDQKEKVRAEEIAIEIQRNEKRFNKQVEESKKILEVLKKDLVERRYSIRQARDKFRETKKQQILKAGRILEEDSNFPNKLIAGKLQRVFRGYISPGHIRKVIMEQRLKWTFKEKGREGNLGTNQVSVRNENEYNNLLEPMTPQDEQYKQAYEDELIRGELFQKVIHRLTNKQNEDFVNIRKRTPEGKHWAHTLLEESKEHMLKLAHQMTDSALQDTLDDLRVIKIIADGFSDIVYSVTKQRENQPRE